MRVIWGWRVRYVLSPLRIIFLTLATLFLIFTIHSSLVSAMLVVNLQQAGYRWRDDDGSETTATWKAAANTAITGVTIGASGEIVRLRFDLRETGGVSASPSPRIEFGTSSDCTSGSWTAADTSTTAWRLATSGNFADGDATTQQISTGTFVAGRMSESSNPTASISLISQVTEVEYALRGFSATSNTTYYFRITNNGTALNTYTNCAQLTTTSPTKVAFTTSSRTVTAGVCSGAGNIITIQLQNSNDVPVTPSGATVIRVTSDSPSETIYSDSGCTTPVTNGDISFSTSEDTKSFYIIDTRKSSTTWTLTASKQSGPDTISNGTQTITINAGTVSRLIVTFPGQTFTDGTGNSGSATTQTAGSNFNITSISATDDYFNVNTGYSGAKTLAYSGPGTSPAPSSTAPTYTTGVSFTNGQSTTSLSTSLFLAESTTITVTDSGQYGYASSSLTVNAGAIFDYTVVAATPITAGTCSTASNSITAYDQWDNQRTADTSLVNMTTSGTGITFYTSAACSSPTTQYTLSGGTAAFYYQTQRKQSGITITATKNADTPTGTSGAVTVDPAAVSTLLIRLPGQSFVDGTGITGSTNFTGLRTPNATAGTSFSADIKAVDAYNNLVDSGTNNYTGAKTISFTDSLAGNAPDTQSPSFPVGITFTNGSANSQTFTYYNATTGRTVEADDTGTPVSGTASSSFTVQAGATENYAVTASSPQTAGAAFNVTITARDDWNNTLGSLYAAPSGSYTLSSTASNAPDGTAPSLGTLVQGDFTNGVAIKSVTLYKVETATFTASEPGPSAVTGTSSSISINPGNVSAHTNDSTISGGPSAIENYPLNITITLVDTWRNPISGVSSSNITVSATGSPSITQPASNTNASGQTTAILEWSTAGSYTVSVAIGIISLVQNDGTSVDADGFLDNTLSANIVVPPTSSSIQGGSVIRGGTILQ